MPTPPNPAADHPTDHRAADHRAAAARADHGHALARLGEWEQAAARYREALALAPGAPESHVGLATALTRLGDRPGAIAALRDAVALAPDNAAARAALGNLLRAAGQPEAALEEFRRALYLRPHDPAARHNLGTALADLGRVEEALVWFSQAAEAGHVPALAALGATHLQTGDPAGALRWFRAARQASDGSGIVRLGEGLALLTLGDLRAGWTGYEARPTVTPFQVQGTAPRWDGSQEVRGRTVLAWAEQGLGDSIMFARYLPLLRARGAQVVLLAQAPLHALLAPLADRVVAEGDSLTFDLHCPLPSLPRAFATTLATIPTRVPYLHPDATRAADWRARLGPHPRIGLAWAGNPDFARDRQRSLPLATLAPLLAIPALSWHILQKELRPGDADILASHPGLQMPGPGFADFADTAACVAGLDLVVTADTAVAHLAGALGRPCWIMLPHAADFRWLRDRDDSPWYPTVRLFRQPRPGDWPAVAAAIAAALATTLARGVPAA